VLTPAVGINAEQLLRRDLYDSAVKLVAADMKVPVADWGAVRFDGAGDLQDGIHPARAYSDRLVEQLAATLDAATGCTQ